MSQTNESSPLEPDLLLDELGTHSATPNSQSSTYTVTFSINLGFMARLADTTIGAVVLRMVSLIIAAGGFVTSLAVILLAPVFPSLVSAPPQPLPPLGEPLAASSPHPRVLRRRQLSSTPIISVSVRRDPNIVPIIERGESASPSPAPATRRVSFSPQSSSGSVPTLADVSPNQAGPSNSHTAVHRVLEESGPAYILPTPPASITSVSSEADDTSTAGADEFGANCTPSVGKRGRRSFPFTIKSKGKGKAVRGHEDEDLRASRPRAQSLGYVVQGASDTLSRTSSSRSNHRHSWLGSSSGCGDSLRESEGETSTCDGASRTSAGDKEARRRSGLSFQDFKAAFGKRERRSSAMLSPSTVSGSYSLASPWSVSDPSTVPRVGLGRPSTAPSPISPRSASDELAKTRRTNSPPLRLDTLTLQPDPERKEVQSPLVPSQLQPQPHSQPSASLFNGEVVIRNESGRLRTRSSAIPGLYTDAEVVRRW